MTHKKTNSSPSRKGKLNVNRWANSAFSRSEIQTWKKPSQLQMTRPVSVQSSSYNSRLLNFFSSIKLIFFRKLAFQWVWSSQITFPLLGIPFQIKIQGTTHWTCCSQSIQEKPSPSAQFAIYVCQHHLLGKGQGRRKSFHRSACECPIKGTHRYWNNSFQHCQLLAQADDPLLFWALRLDKRLKMLNWKQRKGERTPTKLNLTCQHSNHTKLSYL